MQNFEHLGTIEVVVLRCHADPVVEMPTRPVESKLPAPSKQSGKPKKPAKVPDRSNPANPQGKEVDPSAQPYYDMMGGLFDGACDTSLPSVLSTPLGGDGGMDHSSSRRASGQPYGYTMNNENQGVYHPMNQPPAWAPDSHHPRRSRSRGRAHHRFNGDWAGEQHNHERGQSGPSHQRLSSQHGARGNAGPSAGAYQNSPASSVNNVDDNKAWGGTKVPVPSGGPAVVINVTHPAPSVAGWGVPDNPTRPASEQGTGEIDYRPKPMQFTFAPSDPSVVQVDGKWRPARPKNFGWTVDGDEDAEDAGHRRKISHASGVTTQPMPGAWGRNDNQETNTPWNAPNANDYAQNTNWGRGGNYTSRNNDGRRYGGDNSNLGGWRAANNNHNATAGWNNEPISGNRSSGINGGPVPGNWNQGNDNSGPWNNMEAPVAEGGAYHNTPARNSPIPGSPINNHTVMPGAWGHAANGPTQEPFPQAPPPPQPPPSPQPSPPAFTQSQHAAPAPPQQGPPAAHSRVQSIGLSTNPQIKPYWAAWNKPPSPPPAKESNTSRRRSEVSTKAYIVAEEPLYSVPVEIATKKRTSHQVQPGPGAMYAHKVHSPRYMDSMEEPYAVFVFKYRSKGPFPHPLQQDSQQTHN